MEDCEKVLHPDNRISVLNHVLTKINNKFEHEDLVEEIWPQNAPPSCEARADGVAGHKYCIQGLFRTKCLAQQVGAI